MAIVYLAGPDASLTTISGAGACAFNAFTLAYTQSVARGVAFGLPDSINRGCVIDATVTASGITTSGTGQSLLGGATGAGAIGFTSGNPTGTTTNMTLSFSSACTWSGIMIPSGVHASVGMESYHGSTYSYVKTGPGVEVWANT